MTWGPLLLACFYFRPKSKVPQTWIVMVFVSIHGETQLLHTFVYYYWSCVTYTSSEGQNPPNGYKGQISTCIITMVLAAGSDYFYHSVLLSLRLLKLNSLMSVTCATPSLTWASLWLPSPHLLCVSIICKPDPARLRGARYVNIIAKFSSVLMRLSRVLLGLKYSQWIYP